MTTNGEAKFSYFLAGLTLGAIGQLACARYQVDDEAYRLKETKESISCE